MIPLAEGLQAVQAALLRALDTFGLVERIDGQPAWPFGGRVAIETLAIDAALSRQLLWAGASLVLLAVLGLVAWRVRRLRVAGVFGAVAVAVATPRPSPALWWAEAVPTSFHRAPVAAHAASIDAGLRLYATHCASCHGADGRGETARAATLPVWPPRLSGGLVWKRLEGELFWRVRHGVADRAGEPTMPGFGGVLGTADTWALIDALKVIAGGESLRTEGRWSWPLRAPELDIDCGGAVQTLAAWQGQRVRIVVPDAGGAPREDARFQTVVLGDHAGGCGVADPAARRVFAVLAGVDEGALAGRQFLVDRGGWLRASGRPGDGGWRADDLLCRSGSAPAAPGEGLDALLRRMDADPVRAVPGMPHLRPA